MSVSEDISESRVDMDEVPSKFGASPEKGESALGKSIEPTVSMIRDSAINDSQDADILAAA